MQWQDIREHYPNQWLLIEAIKAHTEDDKRVLDQLVVIGVFPDSPTALKGYQRLHKDEPGRELYVFHTSREKLDIKERRWLGIRLG